MYGVGHVSDPFLTENRLFSTEMFFSVSVRHAFRRGCEPCRPNLCRIRATLLSATHHAREDPLLKTLWAFPLSQADRYVSIAALITWLCDSAYDIHPLNKRVQRHC